jgi:hypothetical protein
MQPEGSAAGVITRKRAVDVYARPTDQAEAAPMCGDKNAMEWAGAWMAHKEPPANKVGFM